MNQNDSKRSSVRLPRNAGELVVRVQESIAEKLTGFSPPRAYVLSEALRIGLEALNQNDSLWFNLVQKKSDVNQTAPKKVPKKKDIHTDRSIPSSSSSTQEMKTEIARLRERYDNQELINRTWEAIKSTRSSGKVGITIELGALRKWATKPMEAVYMACERYLDKGCAAEKKKENYLWGMIKGCEQEIIAQKQKPSPKRTENEPAEWRELRNKWLYSPKMDEFALPYRHKRQPDWQSKRVKRPPDMRVPRPPDECCKWIGYHDDEHATQSRQRVATQKPPWKTVE